MITRMHHVSLFVSDIDRSLDFYTRVLGFPLISRSDDWGGKFLDDVCGGIPDLRINIALVDAAGQIVELIQVLSPEGLSNDARIGGKGIARIGFEVDDIERTVDELASRGVQFMSGIVTVTVKPEQHYSDGKAIKFQDPDGIILELQQPSRPGKVT